jgi:putative ATP-binding cassette transporter
MRTVWSILNNIGVPITRAIWDRFVLMMRDLSRSEVGGKARLLGLALIMFLFAINGLNVLNSYINRDFMTSIEHQDMDGFVFYACVYIFVLAIATVVAVLYRYAEESLGLLWRRWLTQQAIDRYLDDRTYFQLHARGELSNPDQRIAEDIRALTATTLSFTLMFLNATFTVVAFSGVLWSISPLLFLVAVAYSILGSLLAIYLGKPLVKLNYDQLDREANFRSRLVHVRENAESVALLRREGRLKARLRDRLNDLTTNFQRIILINRNLGFFTAGYNYLIPIIPALIVAPLFIKGHAEFGVITQSAVAFAHLLGAFSLIITQFQSISAYTAVVARLNALRDAMVQKRPARSPKVEFSDACGSVAFERLTLYSPRDGRVLVKDLTLSIPAGVCLLVRSTSESAKKALLRATADLWYHGEGGILHPGHDEIFFLPERPYLPPGTLRDVLLRTGQEKGVPDWQISAGLQTLNLEHALNKAGGLDTEQNWGDLLSLGEQQRLAFARVLLAAPRFVFLDHPSRALSECVVGELLNLLRLQDITYLTLGDAADDPRFYDRLLDIADDGAWQLRPPGDRREQRHAGIVPAPLIHGAPDITPAPHPGASA